MLAMYQKKSAEICVSQAGTWSAIERHSGLRPLLNRHPYHAPLVMHHALSSSQRCNPGPTLESAIAAAASSDSAGRRRKRNGRLVVREGPEQVLLDGSEGQPRQPQRG